MSHFVVKWNGKKNFKGLMRTHKINTKYYRTSDSINKTEKSIQFGGKYP